MTTDSESPVPPGPLPVVAFENEPFWTGGAGGRLLIVRCRACGWWIHPPVPSCRNCRSTDVGPEAASGRGRLYSYTVNHQAWRPGLAVPYVIAVVELDEQPGLRLTTRLVDPPAEPRIGAAVAVRFQAVEDVWIPLFVLTEEDGA